MFMVHNCVMRGADLQILWNMPQPSVLVPVVVGGCTRSVVQRSNGFQAASEASDHIGSPGIHGVQLTQIKRRSAKVASSNYSDS